MFYLSYSLYSAFTSKKLNFNSLSRFLSERNFACKNPFALFSNPNFSIDSNPSNIENIDNMEISVEDCLDLFVLAELGIDISGEVFTAGWENFFGTQVEVYLELVKQFWKTMKIEDSRLKGTVPGKVIGVIEVSYSSIAEAIGCIEEGEFINLTRDNTLGMI